MKTLLQKLARKDSVRIKKLIPALIKARCQWWIDLIKCGPFPKNAGDLK